MKIYNLFFTCKYQQKPSFKGNDSEWHVFGIDEGGQTKRDYIRDWREETYFPYQSIYETQGRKSEFELNKMISDLIRKSDRVDDKRMQQIPLYNLDIVSDNIYRGAMPTYDELKLVKNFHDAGIRSVIPIGCGYTELQASCEKLGMNYLNMKFSDKSQAFKSMNEVKSEALHFSRDIACFSEKGVEKYVNGSVRSWKKDLRKFLDDFTVFIQYMQKGNVYMGCQFGTYDTDTALMFDYLFNPKMNHGHYLNHYSRTYAACAEALYHNMQPADKLKLGWTKDFEHTFIKRLNIIKEIIRF